MKLTLNQQDIYFEQLLFPQEPIYNVGAKSLIKGFLDTEIFEKSYTHVVLQHDGLRSYVKSNREDIEAVINEKVRPLEILDFSEYANGGDLAVSFMESEFKKVFDLEKDEFLYRFILIKVKENEHYYFCVYHHLIIDGWGCSLINQRLVSNYNELITSKEITTDYPYFYKDFVVEDEKYAHSIYMENDKDYWIKKFEQKPNSFLNPITLRQKENRSSRKELVIERAVYNKLIELATSTQSTTFHVILGILYTYFSRISQEDTFCIGLPILNRSGAKQKKTVGLFAGVNPLLLHVDQEYSFIQLIEKIKSELRQDYRHQRFPLGKLIKELGMFSPKENIFDVTLSYQNQDFSSDFYNTITQLEALNHESERVALAMYIREFDETEDVKLDFDYRIDYFTEESISRLVSHFNNLVNEVLLTPQKKLYELDLLSKEEHNELLYTFNDTKAEYPKDKTIVQLFEEQAEQTPDHIAVVFEGIQLTYRELNERANQLGDYLRKNYSTQADDFIAIKLERSHLIVVGILGILKSGAAYVPMDPEHPQGRIDYIIGDTGSKVTIDGVFLEEFERELEEKTGCYTKENLPIITGSNSLAYVIYTSGTTGNPKGVMIENRNVVRLLFNQKKRFHFSENDVWTMFHSYFFDFSVWEMYGSLLYGGQLIVVPKTVAKDTRLFAELLVNHKVTVLNQTPSAFYNLIEEVVKTEKKLTDLQYVIFGGEALNFLQLKDWVVKYPQVKLINMYGITETTVHVTYKEVTIKEIEEGICNIGKAIPTLQCYILDENKKAVPIGCKGELCVGGDGVGRGYLNLPELTSDKFIENPYIEGDRLYCSGDLARWLPNGDLEYLGRKDFQVKIRGYRIELGEIETSISQFSTSIKQVVVDAKELNGDKFLVAYYTCEDSSEHFKTELREYLHGKLPEYMIPGFFVLLESIPLTVNGKTDKRALPDVRGEDLIRRDYVAPRNEIEVNLVGIWEEVLGLDQVGIRDNFFELGGHSLMVAQVLNRIHQHLGMELSFKDFFSQPRIEGIVGFLSGKEYRPIPQAREEEDYPLTPSQQRLWVLSQLEGGSQAYNMPGVLRLLGDLQVDYFEASFQYVIDRHEILRTNFRSSRESGEIRQCIIPKESFIFQIEELDFSDKQDFEIASYLQESNKQAFNLASGALIRASLLRITEEEHLLFLSIHHIIGDGWSVEVMLSEIAEHYNSLLDGDSGEENKKSIPSLTIQYKDYAVWLRDEIKGEKYLKSEQYWLDQFSGELPVLELPSYTPRPLVQTYNGDQVHHMYSKAFTDKIKYYSEVHGATVFMTLMAGINSLLYRYTSQRDIIIGTPIAGRDHPDVENQLGLYLNTLAIRSIIDENDDCFSSILRKEKEVLLSAYEHQLYPFDELVGKLNIKRDVSRSALFDVLVVFQNQNQLVFDQEIKGLSVEGYAYHRKTSQFDVTYIFQERGGCLELVIEYNTDIYDGVFIEKMFTHFENLLSRAMEETSGSLSVSAIDYLTDEERHELLYKFNDTKTEYPQDKTIVELFEDQVAQTPDDIAVVFEGIQLTYRELNERANQLGYYLRVNYGTEADDLVSIKLDRSQLMIVGILGILKSGAGYVPIDPDYPQERIDYIIGDTGSKVTIDGAFLEEFERELEAKTGYSSKENLPIITNANSLAYVIYTSGTTGNPKGVMIEHRSLCNYLTWASHYYLDNPEEGNFGLFSSLSFDLTVTSIYLPLLNGKMIKIAGNHLEIDEILHDYVTGSEQLDIVKLTPSHLELLKYSNLENSKLQKVIVGGEALLEKQIHAIFEQNRNAIIYNEYGPTESTVGCVVKKISCSDSLTIGKPIWNTDVYIVDSCHCLVPVGVCGTLYVSGSGLSRGYLNQPELTAEKFIDNPFVPGTKMYDTGDLARWLPNGELEYLGRKDFQVKIRGYRIELGEIETSISQFSTSIKQIVVDAKELNGDKFLVAYYTCEDSSEHFKTELREYLHGKLPEYMIPGFFVLLESIPLTVNGKTDKRALPDVRGEDLIRRDYVAPRNEIEVNLVGIWEEVLGLDQVGIRDNFFELGGHSLMVAQVLNRIHQHLGMELSFKDFFSQPRIEGIVGFLSGKEYRPIPQAREEEDYPLTPSQQRLWVLSQLEGGSQAYNMPGVLRLLGDLQVDYFEASFQYVIDRHEILRTNFRSSRESGEIRQCIIPKESFIFQIEELDFSDKQDFEIASYLQESNKQAFNLASGALIRASLLRITEEEHLLFLSIHHIIGDGWSVEVMLSEIAEHYNSLLDGDSGEENKKSIPSLTIQYKDYAVWLRDEIKGEKYLKSEQYWLDQFSGELPVLELPSYTPRPLVQTYNGDQVHHMYSKAFTDKIKYYSEVHGATVFMTLMAGINSLLYRYTSQRDIIIGTPIAGRDHPDVENQLGLYLNTLAIRSIIDENDDCFSSILRKEKEVLLSAYEHQLYPFDELVGKLNIKRDVSRSALFDVLVVFQNQNQLVFDQEIKGLSVEGYAYHRKTSQFDVTYIFQERGGCLELVIEYNTDIYDGVFIEKMFTHFENLLSRAMEETSGSLSVSAIDYLTDEERHELLYKFNDTKTEYPQDKTIVELFEDQVAQTPDDIAVVFEGIQLTYRELNERANQLGYYLRVNYGTEADDLVSIKLDRSQLMIVGILGILKSGAGYVPIDPDYPQERIDYIIGDTGSKVTIDGAFLEEFERELEAKTGYSSKENLPIITNANSLAYVIYTSGTTGNPKGVMIEHRGLANLCKWHNTSFTVNASSKSALFSGQGFDASVWEIFPYLLIGGSLYPLDNETKYDINKLYDFYVKKQITHAYLPPVVLKEFLQKFDLDTIVFLSGGELLDNIYTKNATIFNNYGPTENSVVTSYFCLEKQRTYANVSIGKPIWNTDVYIVDSCHCLVPVGVCGTLYVSGSGLSRGYLNQPELTAEKFIDNPFVPGTKMYDTGDLARWLPNGELEYLGRKDFQVKIRGYRIELGEIETSISQFSTSIKQIVVDAKELNGDKFLVAYYTCEDSSEHFKTELREYLHGKLPEYMIPGFFVLLESIPLTVNGKTDKRALPDVRGEDLIRRDYVAPRNEIEVNLVGIWEEVLGLDQVGIRDNFFELGGHSLMVAQVLNRIHQHLGMELSFKDFFSQPRIEGIVGFLSGKEYRPIPQAREEEDYPLTPSQQRLWVLSQLEGGSQAYNMPGVLRLLGDLQVDYFEASFQYVIDRHEILRTNFRSSRESGEIRQCIIPKESFIFQIEELDFSDKQDFEIASYLQESNKQAFNLASGALIRASLLRITEEEHLLFLSIHHIIGDGWSVEVMLSEIAEHYNSLLDGDSGEENKKSIPSLTIQYKDYAVWLRDEIKGEKYLKSEQYWLDQFSGELPVLELPSYTPRPLVQTYNGDQVHHVYSKAFTDKIKYYSEVHGATVFMTLMAGINSLLYRYTSQRDIIIGTPIAGRDHPDVENQLGLYLNTLAIRSIIDENDDCFSSILRKEKEVLLSAYEHQLYPFDELVGKLNIKRDVSRSALFDVLVVFQNQNQLVFDQEIKGLSVEGYAYHRKTSQFDVTYIFQERGGCLELVIEYNTDIYDGVFIEKMFTHFENLLSRAMEETSGSLSVSAIDYLTDEERHELLYKFNDTKTEYPQDKTIVELFEDQVAQTPDDIAVVFEGIQLTYRELNERANQLGYYLRVNYGTEADDLVSIKLDRSQLMIVGILGILKSGAGYVPIDPDYPQERIDYIIGDTGSKVTIDGAFLEEFERELEAKTGYSSKENLPIITNANSLAYVIYTSGTTGNPKGVMIENRNVVRLVKPCDFFPLNEDRILLSTGSINFDATILEYFGSLLNGCRLVIICRDELLNLELLKQSIEKESVNTMWMTSSWFSQVLDSESSIFENIKQLIIGGDTLSPNHIFRLKNRYPNIAVYNGYGPTENTTFSTTYKIENDWHHTIPIGRPISNSEAYILDQDLQVLPIGISGELYVSGAGLSRGYLNQPELTAEKFIDHPFVPGTKMYATGDLALWLPDGNIDFLGRKDFQVKIRGYRIELGEIETGISQFSPSIKQVVVDAKELNGDKVLVAYYTSDDSSEHFKTELREYLHGKLPEYMIPGFFVLLESMPLTANGKTDKRALPNVTGEDLIRREYIVPRNEIEEKLVGIWQEILGLQQIGVTDNFFELGGNSISAMRLLFTINKQFNKDYSVAFIFKNNSIEKIVGCYLEDEFNKQSEYCSFGNQESDAVIFAFPPILGYGFVYWNLFQSFDEFKIISFDFIEDKEDLVEYYVALINEHSENQKSINLFGWSAAGCLIYEVADILITKHQKKIDCIIMLDSLVIKEEYLEQTIEGFEHLKMIYGEEFMKKATIKKDKYIQHIRNLKYDRLIACESYIIKAEQSEHHDWEKYYQKTHYLDGKGIHPDMLNDDCLDYNTHLVKKILGIHSAHDLKSKIINEK